MNNAKVVLCTPALIGEQMPGNNELDEELDHFCNIIRNIAAELNIPLVDIRSAFVNFLNENNFENKAKGILTIDGVHLNFEGNEMVAELMWDVIKNVK